MTTLWEKGLAVLCATDRDRFFKLLGKGEINVSTGEPVKEAVYDEIMKLGKNNELKEERP